MGVDLSSRSANGWITGRHPAAQNHSISSGIPYILALLMGVDLSSRSANYRFAGHHPAAENHRLFLWKSMHSRLSNGGGSKLPVGQRVDYRTPSSRSEP